MKNVTIQVILLRFFLSLYYSPKSILLTKLMIGVMTKNLSNHILTKKLLLLS